MPLPRIRANVPPRKEWAISPGGHPRRVSMAPNVAGPLMYADDGETVLVKDKARREGWLAFKDEVSPDLYQEFMAYSDLADQWSRKKKPPTFPEREPTTGIPSHLVPEVCRERLGLPDLETELALREENKRAEEALSVVEKQEKLRMVAMVQAEKQQRAAELKKAQAGVRSK